MRISSETSSILAVERAAGDLRRGFPVTISDNGKHLMLLSAEYAEGEGLAALRRMGNEPRLLMTETRLRFLFAKKDHKGAGSFALDNATFNNFPRLHELALATEGKALKSLPFNTATVLEHSALELIKISELLPAAVVADVFRTPPKPFLTLTTKQIESYPRHIASQLRPAAEAPLHLAGDVKARIIAFRTTTGGREHYAIIVGEPDAKKAPLVRVHSSCYTGDLLASLACDCRDQLHTALAQMAEEGGGILLYMMQEGRGIGLPNKLRAYALKDKGLDTVDANLALGFDEDERQFLPAAEILRQLGVSTLRLLSNNPRKAKGLEESGIKVESCVPLLADVHDHNRDYLHTKATRLGHTLPKGKPAK